MNKENVSDNEMQKERDAFAIIRIVLDPIFEQKGITHKEQIAYAQQKALRCAGFNCRVNVLVGSYPEIKEITRSFFAHQFLSGQVISCMGQVGWDAMKHAANMENREEGLGPFLWEPMSISTALLRLRHPNKIPSDALGDILAVAFASIDQKKLSSLTPTRASSPIRRCL